jgi:hypothetical protein
MQYFEKYGKRHFVVDIEEINKDENCRFYIEGRFIKEKNDNSATAMPIGLGLFNEFLTTIPLGQLKKVEWIKRFMVFKRGHNPEYSWESAKRIVGEMTGFFRSYSLLGVKVVVAHRNQKGEKVIVPSNENFLKDMINWPGREVYLLKVKDVWIKDAKQTLLG